MHDAIRDPDTGLTQRQERALVALISQPTIAKAAEAAEVGERTIHEWIRQDRFGTEYRKRRREAFTQTIALAQRFAPLAMQTLAKALVDDEAPYACKVAAATTILRFGRESLELDDLAERIKAIETRVAGERGPARPVRNVAKDETDPMPQEGGGTA